jgi:predicted deacetylase
MSSLIVAIHDVAPATFEACATIVKVLEKQGPIRFSLLLVPFYHRQRFISQHADLLKWLKRREQLGDEIVLHGLTHTDDQIIQYPWDRMKRRVYTTEGEFAALSIAEAKKRLIFARSCLDALEFSVNGFVAPAWLFPPFLLDLLAESGFSYTTTLRKLIVLPQQTAITLSTIVYSTRSAWRKQVSLLYNQMRYLGAKQTDPLRIVLHPGDVDATILAHSQRLLKKALAKRQSLTKYETILQCGAVTSSSLRYR